MHYKEASLKLDRGSISWFHHLFSFSVTAFTRGHIILNQRHFTAQGTAARPLLEKLDHVLITKYMIRLYPEEQKNTYSHFKVHFLFGKMNLKITNSMRAPVPVQPESMCIFGGICHNSTNVYVLQKLKGWVLNWKQFPWKSGMKLKAGMTGGAYSGTKLHGIWTKDKQFFLKQKGKEILSQKRTVAPMSP